MTKYVEETYAKIAGIYTTEFFDDKSDIKFIDTLIQKLKPHHHVLDIGSGPGQFTKYLLEKDFAAEGIDTSDEMLAIARQKVPRGTFTKMDMRKLKYADDSFEGILAAYSIIHIPTSELSGVLTEIKRVLKPNGYALFITQEGEADQVLDEPLAKGEKIFVNFFNTQRLNALLGEAGFDIIKQHIKTQASEDLSSEVIYTLVTHP